MRCARKAARQQRAATRAIATSTTLGASQSQRVAAMPAAKSHAAWKSGTALRPAEAGLSRLSAEAVGSACMRLKSGKVLWGTSLSGAAQMDHCLQVKGLGKKVGKGNGMDGVAGSDEHAQVAGQGRGVAGDVDERGCRDLAEQ